MAKIVVKGLPISIETLQLLSEMGDAWAEKTRKTVLALTYPVAGIRVRKGKLRGLILSA